MRSNLTPELAAKQRTESILAGIGSLTPGSVYGTVTKVLGLIVEITGFPETLSLGWRVTLCPDSGARILCEVVGFKDDKAIVMPFGPLEGVGLGCKAEIMASAPVIYPNHAWLGRVINALGEPLDGKGPLPVGQMPMLLKAPAPPANKRQRLGEKLDLGVRAVNCFLSTVRGQRMGIFSGSGVGKSVLLSMMARYTVAEVSVIGLIGERGREVQEFIDDDLGEDGLARSVVIVATGDEAPLMRRQAAFLTMATAEYFRQDGRDVLCMMDSLTRFAMAIREIGLSAGEPPTTKGYPPTMYGEMAKLLERAGPGEMGQGSMTGIFSVLVEGDDMNEPVADAVRGIIDGHIVMDRAIADRGRYPAIDILKSVSRAMPQCLSPQQWAIVKRAKQFITTYEDMAELIRLGAYRKGADPKVDEAVQYYPLIEEFLTQNKDDHATITEAFTRLAQILDMEPPTDG
ncbi:MAG TPA: flagellar protein export ATPase FliI [Alphaproteobacteria bacterium]